MSLFTLIFFLALENETALALKGGHLFSMNLIFEKGDRHAM